MPKYADGPAISSGIQFGPKAAMRAGLDPKATNPQSLDPEARKALADFSDYQARARYRTEKFLALFGLVPDDITRDFANKRRELLGIQASDETSSREQVLEKLDKMVAETPDGYPAFKLFQLRGKKLVLFRDGHYCFFIYYDEEARYFKKSVTYRSKEKAMERYEAERINWIKLVDLSNK
jgi:hypothetical protein